MSYNSIGLMDDVIGFVESAQTSPGTILPGKKYRKFKINNDRDERTIDGNTKITSTEFMRAYILCGARGIEVMADKVKEIFSIETYGKSVISKRFDSHMKRFYMWVAHAYFKENTKKLKAYTKCGLFSKNEARIAEWVSELHSKSVTNTCNNCIGTGLVLKENGPFLLFKWDYCTCKAGKARKAIIHT